MCFTENYLYLVVKNDLINYFGSESLVDRAMQLLADTAKRP